MLDVEKLPREHKSSKLIETRAQISMEDRVLMYQVGERILGLDRGAGGLFCEEAKFQGVLRSPGGGA